ncbi:MAG: cytochrome C oxidase subunit IV family protein [Melioribacteraceae bacterium]|nr:cytochrome C oxidase subunit IV family protein [Melioribacteraceae bacterium]WKZ71177.1 MAG: cytochrome C oxidase subunit IV family protein [Melioribacteraceae bacterium]
MEHGNTEHKEHSHGYGIYILVWLALIALTSITVTVAGVDFGKIALPIALFIAAVKSMLVINFFMHIKYEDAIFKVFLLLSGMTLLVIFILTFFDVFYR